MADWLRNSVMLMVMICWGSYIIISLIRGNDIDQVVWGIPGVIYYALNPTWRRPKADSSGGREVVKEEEG